MAGYRSLGRWGNRATAQITLTTMDAVYAGAIRGQRTSLGLPPARPRALRRLERKRRWPVLHGFSPAVVPRPTDWRAGLDVVGYWWPHEDADWRPSAELSDFLASGPPPVFIGFGSMMTGDAARLSEVAVHALRAARVRGVLQAGWAGLAADSDDVLTIADAPHGWLFPRMSAVVHHAGAGTTGAALRAGVPAVPVPTMVDQFFWANRLHALRASPPPIPVRRLDADRLASAIRAVHDEPRYRAVTSALADRLRVDDGAGRVVDAVNRLLG